MLFSLLSNTDCHEHNKLSEMIEHETENMNKSRQ